MLVLFVFSGVTMKKGMIILLNGVSSAGKTTLARALQKQSSEYYWWLANDTFCDMVPEKFWDIDQPEAEYQALSLLGKTIRMFSDCGKNVIVDTVMINAQKHDLLKEYMELLVDYPVCKVHVTCPVAELQKREKARGDRSIGQAESQLPLLSMQDSYDISVDTFNKAVNECAGMILDFVDKSYKC